MVVTLLVLAGMCFGISITVLIHRVYHIGDLVIDQSDPDDDPYLFLELHESESVRKIRHKKYVILKVNSKNYISHK